MLCGCAIFTEFRTAGFVVGFVYLCELDLEVFLVVFVYLNKLTMMLLTAFWSLHYVIFFSESKSTC